MRLTSAARRAYDLLRDMGDVHTGDGIERVPRRQAILAPDGGEGGSVLRALGSKAEERAKRRKKKKDSYAEYLESETWKKIRRAVLKRDGHTCRACKKHAQVVHHVRYPKNLGEEKMEWLYSLCARCHDEIHALAAGGMTLKAATNFVLETTTIGNVTRLPDDWQLSPGATRNRTLRHRKGFKQGKKKRKNRKLDFTPSTRKVTKLQKMNDELHAVQKRAREKREERRNG